MVSLTPYSRWLSRGEAVQCVADYMQASGKRTFQSPKSCGGEVILLCTGSKNGGDCPVKVRIRRTKVKNAEVQEWYIPQNGLILQHSDTCSSTPKQQRSRMVSSMVANKWDKPQETHSTMPGSPCFTSYSSVTTDPGSPAMSVATRPTTTESYECCPPTYRPIDSLPTPPKEYVPSLSAGHYDTESHFIDKRPTPLPTLFTTLQETKSTAETPTTSTSSSATYQSVFSDSNPTTISTRRRAHSHSASFSRPPFTSLLTTVQEGTDLMHPSDSISKMKLMMQEIDMAKRHRLDQALVLLQHQQTTPETRHAATRLFTQDDHCCIVFVTLDPDLRWEWLYREINKRQIHV